VLTGMKTLEQRMLKKCINTWSRPLARLQPAGPVSGPANSADPNHTTAARVSYLGLPAPLVHHHFEAAKVSRITSSASSIPSRDVRHRCRSARATRSCSARADLHSDSPEALKEAGITRRPSASRSATNRRELIGDFLARPAIDDQIPLQPKFMLPRSTHRGRNLHRRAPAARGSTTEVCGM